MDMTFTLKTLKKHASVVTVLLDGNDCDYAFTGAVTEPEGVDTHCWFVSRPRNNDEIGIEDSLESLAIPYDRSHRGPQFRPYSLRLYRIDENREGHSTEYRFGDNTLRLMDELEDAIAGSDYTIVRNFIEKKRRAYFAHLDWSTQLQYALECEVA
jgi:hypothetical protein